MEKEFISMVDLGYHEEPTWYQKIENNTVEHIDPQFYGIYGNEEDGFELAYWREDMEAPFIGNMYYDEKCTQRVDIDVIEIAR